MIKELEAKEADYIKNQSNIVQKMHKKINYGSFKHKAENILLDLN